MKTYVGYMLECSDGSYYTGSASDLSQRLWQHEIGASPTAYTYSRRPVKLVWTSEEVQRYSDALRYERQIKGWSRTKKDWYGIHEIVKSERKLRENNKSKPPR